MNAEVLSTHVDPTVNMAHQVLYRFTALCLLDPRAGAWDQLNAMRESALIRDAAEFIRCDPTVWPARLGQGELPAAELNPASVFSALPDSADHLNRQYEAVFGLLVSSTCPPYEMEYINGKFAVQRSQTLADISGFYDAFGLRPSSTHPERHDHIVLQLEFMAVLFGLELEAARSEGALSQERSAICYEARELFFHEHLGWWGPAFAHLLAREAGQGFYGRVARVLAALLTTQRSGFGMSSAQGSPKPSTIERPEECEGCAFSER